MELDNGFRHRSLMTAPSTVEKAQTRLSQGMTLRQSWDVGPDGSRRWVVDTNMSEEHTFDTFEDAMSFVRTGA